MLYRNSKSGNRLRTVVVVCPLLFVLYSAREELITAPQQQQQQQQQQQTQQQQQQQQQQHMWETRQDQRGAVGIKLPKTQLQVDKKFSNLICLQEKNKHRKQTLDDIGSKIF